MRDSNVCSLHIIIRIVLIFAMGMALNMPVFSSPLDKSISLEKGIESYSISPHAYLYEEKQKIDIQTALALFQKGEFFYGNDSLNKGMKKNAYWVAVNVKVGPNMEHNWILQKDLPFLRRADIYLVNQGKVIQTLKIGHRVDTDDTYMTTNLANTEISFPTNQTTTLLVRVEAALKSLDMTIMSHKNFHKSSVRRALTSGLFYGAMIIMAAYNLFLFSSIRDRVYLFYVAFISSYAIYQSNIDGFFPVWFLENRNHLFETTVATSIICLMIFSALYTREFLLAKNQTGLSSKVFNIFLWVFLAATVFLLPGFATTTTLIIYISLASLFCTAVITVSYYAWRVQGYRPAKYFFSGWLIFSAGTLIFAYSAVLGLGNYGTGKYLQQFGAILEVTLLSFALASRIKTLKSQSEMAENQVVKLKQSEEQAIEEKLTIEERSQAKSKFLSSMSHELRTPLNAVIGYAHLLKDDKTLKSEQQEQINEIDRAGKHLLNIINDILDFSKAEAGNLTVNRVPTIPKNCIDECLKLLKNSINERDIKVNKYFNTLEDIVIFADEFRLKQVFINLLSNAVKYNKRRGRINISFKKVDNDNLRIEIADTGIGIPEEYQDEVFEEFKRSRMEQSNIEGAGIGMPISKRLVELMGGNIDFESEKNIGSKFWVEFKISHKNKKETSTEDHFTEDTIPLNVRANCNILYIEDNRSNIRVLQAYADKHPELSLSTAEDARPGIYSARSNNFDLIILDINLPEINGYEALNIIKNDPLTQSIPVIALTANSAVQNLAADTQFPFDAYLTKPVDFNLLTQTLNRFLGKH